MSSPLPGIVSSKGLDKRPQEGSITLVAIDLEGQAEDASEIGLAICSRLEPMKLKGTYKSFTRENRINTITIRPRERARSREHSQKQLRFGEEPQDVQNDLEATICDYIRHYPSQPLVLVVFGSQTELT
jgi:hypothetical protein